MMWTPESESGEGCTSCYYSDISSEKHYNHKQNEYDLNEYDQNDVN